MFKQGGKIQSRLFGMAVVALLPLFFASAVGASDVTVVRHPALGAEAWFGACPFEPGPAGTSCYETHVRINRGYELDSGGSVSPPHAPWYADAQTTRFDFNGTDNPDATVIRYGDLQLRPEQASIDSVHLLTAAANFSMPMSDGSTLSFNGTWHANSQIFVFGANGGALGIPHHFTDGCFTVTANAHQRLASAQMTGTLNGSAVQSYPWDFSAAIFDNRFTIVAVAPTSCLP